MTSKFPEHPVNGGPNGSSNSESGYLSDSFQSSKNVDQEILDEAKTISAQLYELISDPKNQWESKERAMTQIKIKIYNINERIKLFEKLKPHYTHRRCLIVRNLRDEIDHLTSCFDYQISIKDDFFEDLGELQNKENKLHENAEKKLEENIAYIQAMLETQQQLSNMCMECAKLESQKQDHATAKRSVDTLNVDNVQRIDLKQKQKKGVEDSLKLFQLKRELHINENKEKHLKEDMLKIQNRIVKYQQKIESLNNDLDPLSIYGPWMPILVRKIEEAVKNKKFSRPPIGPIGRYIEVKNEKWAYAIEKKLGVELLTSFLVNNMEDSKILSVIREQVLERPVLEYDPMPAILCSEFCEQKLVPNLPTLETSHPPYYSLLRNVNISNVIVRNFLVCKRGIDTILLVEDKELCKKFSKCDKEMPRYISCSINCHSNAYIRGDLFYPNHDQNRQTRILITSHYRRTLQDKASKIHKLITEACLNKKQLEKECAQLCRDHQTLKVVITRNKTKLREFQNIIKLDELKELKIEMHNKHRRFCDLHLQQLVDS